MKYDTYREAFKPEKTIYVVAVHCLRLSLTQTFFATNYNFSIWWKVSWKSVSCCWSEISSTSYLFKSCCNIQKKTICRKPFFFKWLLVFFFSVSSTDFYFHIQCDGINCYNIEPKIWWFCRLLSSPVLSLKLFNLLNRFSQILRVSALNNSTFVKFSLSPPPNSWEEILASFLSCDIFTTCVY